MGLEVKRKGNLFRVISSISDEPIHNDDWVELDEVKRELINRKFFDFIQECIKIDFDFPKGYYVNGVQGNSSDGLDYFINHTGAEVFEYVEKMFKRLGIQMDFTERKGFSCPDDKVKEYLNKNNLLYQISGIDKIRSRDLYIITTTLFNQSLLYSNDLDTFYRDKELSDKLDDSEVCYLKERISRYRDEILGELKICDNILK